MKSVHFVIESSSDSRSPLFRERHFNSFVFIKAAFTLPISSRNASEKNPDSHQTLVFNREFGIFIENFYLSKDYSMKNYLLSFTVLATVSLLAGC